MVTKLVEGSIKVEWTVVDAAAAWNIFQRNKETKKLKLHRYFQHFSLSHEDFDPKGNIEYKNEVKKRVRGQWPYYIPVHCKRYGLKVNGRYDDKKNSWLKMNGNKDEWAVAFHGVKHPGDPFQDKMVLNSIMSGLEKGEMLQPGKGQWYRNNKPTNHP